MTQDFKCPKCQAEMVQGFILDYSEGASKSVSSWVEGQPKKSFWSGLKNTPVGGGMPIGAFRCKRCGYLEFYADEKFAAQ
jgi:predicted nucleic-acid-binding Zn-ribbon protein